MLDKTSLVVSVVAGGLCVASGCSTTGTEPGKGDASNAEVGGADASIGGGRSGAGGGGGAGAAGGAHDASVSNGGSDTSNGGSDTSERLDGGLTQTTLADDSASAIVVRGEYLYYASESEGLKKVPVTGGTPTTLLASPGTTGVAPGVYPVIAVDATHVYGVVSDSKNIPVLMRVPLGGGASEVLAELLPLTPFAIAVDETRVYVTLGYGTEGPSLVSVPLAGGSVTTLGTLPCTRGLESGPGRTCLEPSSGLALSTTDAYFTVNGALVSVPLRGGDPVHYPPPEPLAGAGDVALLGATVYWITPKTQNFRQIPEASGGEIWKRDVYEDGGVGTTVSYWGSSVGAHLAVDEHAVYWVNTDPLVPAVETSRIMAMKGSSSSPLVVAAMDSGIRITNLAVDTTSLYFTTTDTDTDRHRPSAIMKLTPK